MTPVPVRPFDMTTVRVSAQEQAYSRGRECLRVAPVQTLSWSWEPEGLAASGIVRDLTGRRFSPELEWDGQALSGTCSCGVSDDRLCAHQVALAIHVLKLNPWRNTAPSGWQAALELALPPALAETGEQRFLYRVEVRTQPGESMGRLRLRLSRVRWGKRGLGQESPYPANRLKGPALDVLPHEERVLIAWLLPLQAWNLSRNFGYTADPRFLEVPPPLVDATLQVLTRLPLVFLGETGDTPLRVSESPLYFRLATEAAPNGALRLTGLLTESKEEPENDDTRNDEVFPELLIGERPCYALMEGVFYPIVQLDRPELWSLTRAGDTLIPYRDLPLFLEKYAPTLERRQILRTRALRAAIPEVLIGFEPQPVLTLEEEGGQLVAHLAFRYGPDLVVPSSATREVEELEARGRRFLVHRDRARELEQVSMLIEAGMTEAATGRFEAGGEAGLRFLLERLPELLNQGWRVEGEERLTRYRPSRLPVRVRGAIVTGMDWFDVALYVEHGDQSLPMGEVFQAWQAGRRFIRFGNGEQALLPDAWLSRNRALLTALLGENGILPAALEEGLDARNPATAPDARRAIRAPRYLAPLIEGLWDEDVVIDADSGWQRFQEGLRHFGNIEPVALPHGLNAELRDYQHRGVEWLCFLRDHGLGGILADDMGLGKTVQALTLLLLEKQRLDLPFISLVVAPTSVLFNWQIEANRFAPDLRVVVMHGPDRHARLEAMPDVDVLVTSYALLRRDLALHLERQYRYAILDEAQWVKNPDSQTALAVRSLRADNRITLTGTPIENRLAGVWSQFAFVMPGLFPSLRRFMSDYVVPIERDHHAGRLHELRRRIHPFVLRRLKEEVAAELPPRTDIVLYCELEGSQRRLYQAVLKASRERVLRVIEEKGAARARMTALDALLKLRQICCHPGLVHLPEALGVENSAKLELFRETIQEILAEGHRLLVFSQFVEMLTVLREELEASGVTYEYLDGRTRDRQQRVDRFNAGSAPVFLISLKAGGTGLNLASADYVIHYDPWWNPAVEDQATDRAYRIGQTRPVFSYKLIARDTVEEKILQLQGRKRELAHGLLDTEGGVEKILSPEDFDFLFEDDNTDE